VQTEIEIKQIMHQKNSFY